MTAASNADSKAKRPLDALGWVLILFGLITLANALWMLAGPMHWYEELPAAVPDTGPFNPHFVRDIGCAFLTNAVALLYAAFRPVYRRPLVGIAGFFLAAHALLHVYDTVRGALGHNHWLLDLPGVYLPGIIVPLIAWKWTHSAESVLAQKSAAHKGVR